MTVTDELAEVIESKTDWTVAEIRSPFNMDMMAVLLINNTYSIWCHLTGLEVVEAGEDPDTLADIVLERAQEAVHQHKLTIN